MVRSMLISVSGIVGSGKSTTTKEIVRLLQERGIVATATRFRSLPCFGIAQAAGRSGQRLSEPSNDTPKRWTGYRRRRLTLAAALLYATRIVLFRIYRRSSRPGECQVLNRYFYDVFVHYKRTSAVERAYGFVLRSLMPVPDLAILTTADAATIASRRPNYSLEYLQEAGDAYADLRATFPELVELNTNSGNGASAQLERLLRDRLE